MIKIKIKNQKFNLNPNRVIASGRSIKGLHHCRIFKEIEIFFLLKGVRRLKNNIPDGGRQKLSKYNDKALRKEKEEDDNVERT